ncbi:uncharacterized protein G2W53_033535 [Senna tora]|uniref:DUF4283 domain-containing protein n=1 Tax=Senna tora TaxID=362788 RepID=A0A834SYP0_9FABA|nr:uncharacterized protein G2W53_033535 [Senna tora]
MSELLEEADQRGGKVFHHDGMPPTASTLANQPKHQALIIRIWGLVVPPQDLSRILVDSWKLKAEPRLMGIGQGFFLVVFRFAKDRWRALLAGPTLINGHFMSIQLWSPRFNPLENTKKAFSPIWVRLENLPMEFYHRDVLVQIGNSLGTFLGLDADTHSLSKLKFACIYVLTNFGSKQTADWVTVKPKKKKLPILAKSRFGKSIEDGKLQNLGGSRTGKVNQQDKEISQKMNTDPPHPSEPLKLRLDISSVEKSLFTTNLQDLEEVRLEEQVQNYCKMPTPVLQFMINRARKIKKEKEILRREIQHREWYATCLKTPLVVPAFKSYQGTLYQLPHSPTLKWYRFPSLSILFNDSSVKMVYPSKVWTNLIDAMRMQEPWVPFWARLVSASQFKEIQSQERKAYMDVLALNGLILVMAPSVMLTRNFHVEINEVLLVAKPLVQYFKNITNQVQWTLKGTLPNGSFISTSMAVQMADVTVMSSMKLVAGSLDYPIRVTPKQIWARGTSSSNLNLLRKVKMSICLLMTQCR